MIERDGLIARAAELGNRIMSAFRQAFEGKDGIISVRGRGLMVGIELDRACGDLVNQALEEGLLINVAADRIVRLLPPLILTDDEADDVVSRVVGLVNAFIESSD